MVKFIYGRHRRKLNSRISVKVPTNKILHGKVVANRPIVKQTRKQISEVEQYKNLIKLLK